MISTRIRQSRDRIRSELESAFIEEYTSQEVALSFGIGLFITALPTLGTGFLLFAALLYLFKRLSELAMLASVLVLNPFVKWGVYASSYWLGGRLLGPVPLAFDGDILAASPDVLLRLWVGNLVLAVVFSAVGYLIALRVAVDLRRRKGIP
jgi:uncharacterized protein (DUF2062 family)